MGLLLYHWLSMYLRPWGACLAAMLAMLAPQAAILARLSSPDAMSACITLAVLFLLIERRDLPRTTLLLALLAICIRHSNLLLLFLAAANVAWRDPGSRRTALGCLAAGMVIFVALKNLYGNFGWATFFHHSVIERLAYPRDFAPYLSLWDYARVYLHLARADVTFQSLWWWWLLGLPVLYARFRIGGLGDPWLRVVGSGLFAALLLWLLLPKPSPGIAGRLYVPYYLSMLSCAVVTAGCRTGLCRPAIPRIPA